ncbi:hypothetical protein ES703_24607 [subsurface metagenome]
MRPRTSVSAGGAGGSAISIILISLRGKSCLVLAAVPSSMVSPTLPSSDSAVNGSVNTPSSSTIPDISVTLAGRGGGTSAPGCPVDLYCVSAVSENELLYSVKVSLRVELLAMMLTLIL